jgi:hypothetical protein
MRRTPPPSLLASSCPQRSSALLAAVALLALGTLLALGGLAPSAAQADVFGPISLASDGLVSFEGSQPRPEQAFYAHDPAISGNGRYVVFDGDFGTRSGVWRRELQAPYRLQPVAVGQTVPGGETCLDGSPCDAELPSISENGQYVSFTTTARLEPNESAGGANVYVRNMEVAESQPCPEEGSLHPSQPCPYALASAVNGSAEGLSYEEDSSGEYGSVASGRSAISANGQEVAFVTTAISDLAGSSTPALQVAVRDLDSGVTELVSSEYDQSTGQTLPNHPVSATEDGTTVGAVYSPGVQPPHFPFNNRAYHLPPAVGASINAEGTTVTWMGRDIDQQARMLPDEDVSPFYAETLWRRFASGALTPTRRVTGGSQPEDSACAESGELALPNGLTAQSLADPCQGPFAVDSKSGIWAGTVGDSIPQLSADGETVAFVASAQLVSLGGDFGRSAEGEADDLYVANMQEGLNRDEALQPITQLASGHESDPASDAPIVDVAVSPDGRQVAFTTERTEFPLGSPAYISQPSAVAGMSELYDADLANDTLTRVSHGYEGGPSERPHKAVNAGESDPYAVRTDGALSPSFDDAGNTLVFASTASNLVYGDDNTPSTQAESGSDDGSDVFAVSRATFEPVLTETYVSKAPPSAAPASEWHLFTSAASLRDGRVRVTIETPGAGVISVYVRSSVPDTSAASVARAASSEPSHTRAHATQVQRYVALGFTFVDAPPGGFATVTLSLGASYRALAARPGGLSGTATVTFSPGVAWRPPMVNTLHVLFHGAPPHASAAHASRHRSTRQEHRR